MASFGVFGLIQVFAFFVSAEKDCTPVRIRSGDRGDDVLKFANLLIVDVKSGLDNLGLDLEWVNRLVGVFSLVFGLLSRPQGLDFLDFHSLMVALMLPELGLRVTRPGAL